MRAVVMMVLCGGCVTAVTGCGRGKAHDDLYYRRQWFLLRNQPIRFCMGRAAGTWPPRDEQAIVDDDLDTVPFKESRQVFGYRILSAPAQALLLDRVGTPIWAGSWAVIGRAGEGKNLFLFEAYPGESPMHGALYDVWQLAFGDDGEVLRFGVVAHGYVPWDGFGTPTELGMVGYSAAQSHPADERAPWLDDIDGDGYDELVIVAPNTGPTYAERASIHWELILIAPVRDLAAAGEHDTGHRLFQCVPRVVNRRGVSGGVKMYEFRRFENAMSWPA